jgi:tetratricopeptide (TPR) repeat protein
LQQEKYSEAYMTFQSVLLANPQQADAISNIGKCLEMLGHKRDAKLWYKQALDVQPSHKGARLNLALALQAEYQYEASILQYEALARQNHNGDDVLFNYGVCLEHAVQVRNNMLADPM